MGRELVVDDARVTYSVAGRGQLNAVDGVSFTLEPGTVLGLVGESGCGKSTLARALCGLTPLSGGGIRFGDKPVAPMRLSRREPELLRVQMVFQNPYASLNPRRRIGKQLEDARRIHPGQAPTVGELLDEVELPRSTAAGFPYQFSGGQRQRIAIARAMATGPEVLIGDEPIASLDASLQSKVAQLMRRVALDSGAALLFISHDLAIVRTIADRVLVMSAGKIVESGPTQRVWQQPEHPYTKRLLGAIPAVDGLGRIPLVEPR
ncbi:ABC transporter ATP-binding protein [Gryllotalpicola ginsengisoli]|uniref:ABC transporter ATP-binding protein n=1 Tax=Gryllotalpicola ginsengisoli TaxID=444608 RepID=UPI00040C0D0E|nr:ATP-binding cassette domain-containing protein [Gryllotalpicola ginsengisoli]